MSSSNQNRFAVLSSGGQKKQKQKTVTQCTTPLPKPTRKVVTSGKGDVVNMRPKKTTHQVSPFPNQNIPRHLKGNEFGSFLDTSKQSKTKLNFGVPKRTVSKPTDEYPVLPKAEQTFAPIPIPESIKRSMNARNSQLKKEQDEQNEPKSKHELTIKPALSDMKSLRERRNRALRSAKIASVDM